MGRAGATPQTQLGGDNIPGAARAHATQEPFVLVVARVVSPIWSPPAHHTAASSSFSNRILASRCSLGTSLAAGMGKERTGRSPQALFSRLHRRAHHFKNPILGFVVAFLQGPSLCREVMMRVSHFGFHGINVQNKWSKLHCAGRREQGRACK